MTPSRIYKLEPHPSVYGKLVVTVQLMCGRDEVERQFTAAEVLDPHSRNPLLFIQTPLGLHAVEEVCAVIRATLTGPRTGPSAAEAAGIPVIIPSRDGSDEVSAGRPSIQTASPGALETEPKTEPQPPKTPQLELGGKSSPPALGTSQTLLSAPSRRRSEPRLSTDRRGKSRST